MTDKGNTTSGNQSGGLFGNNLFPNNSSSTSSPFASVPTNTGLESSNIFGKVQISSNNGGLFDKNTNQPSSLFGGSFGLSNSTNNNEKKLESSNVLKIEQNKEKISTETNLGTFSTLNNNKKNEAPLISGGGAQKSETTSIFNNPTTSLFGASQNNQTSTVPFGDLNKNTTSSPTLFTQKTENSKNPFGDIQKNDTSPSFGTNQPNLFSENNLKNTSNTSGIFNFGNDSNNPSKSIFDNKTPTTNTQSNTLFTNSSNSNTGSNLFGSTNFVSKIEEQKDKKSEPLNSNSNNNLFNTEKKSGLNFGSGNGTSSNLFQNNKDDKKPIEVSSGLPTNTTKSNPFSLFGQANSKDEKNSTITTNSGLFGQNNSTNTSTSLFKNEEKENKSMFNLGSTTNTDNKNVIKDPSTSLLSNATADSKTANNIKSDNMFSSTSMFGNSKIDNTTHKETPINVESKENQTTKISSTKDKSQSELIKQLIEEKKTKNIEESEKDILCRESVEDVFNKWKNELDKQIEKFNLVCKNMKKFESSFQTNFDNVRF